MHPRTPSFGERIGRLVPPPIQIEGLDYKTKIQMFNALHDRILHSDNFYSFSLGSQASENYQKLLRKIWTSALGENILRFNAGRITSFVSTFMCESGKPFYEIFGFLENIFQSLEKGTYKIDSLIDHFNQTLIDNNVAWRLTSNLQFVAVGNEEELNEMEETYKKAAQFPSITTIQIHLTSAISLLKGPHEVNNLRLSIKESISMVGVIARKISGENDLGKALNGLGKKNLISPALEYKFKQYYSYTNDKNGIRHELMEEPELSVEEARYFLIACSAFTNYLIEKASKSKLL